jgi:hypothetical protein
LKRLPVLALWTHSAPIFKKRRDSMAFCHPRLPVVAA